MNSRTEPIQRVLDREAIREMVVRYYDAVWRDDIDTIVGLFAPDGGIEVANGPLGGQTAHGPQALRSFYEAGIAKMTPRPFGHNHTVEIEGEYEAVGRSYVELRSSTDFSWVGAVIYTDQYTKIDGEWKLQSRSAEMQNIP